MSPFCCCCTEVFVKGGETKFFKFPDNEELKKKWIRNIKRPNFTPSRYSKVCSKHFMPEDLIHSAAMSIPKHNAVPSLFNRVHKGPIQRKRNQQTFRMPPPDSSTQPIPERSLDSDSESDMELDAEADSDIPTATAPGKSSKPPLAMTEKKIKKYKSVLDFTEDDMKNPRLAILAFELAKKTIEEQRMQIKRLSNRNRSCREQQEPLKRIIKSVAKCKGISLDELSRYL